MRTREDVEASGYAPICVPMIHQEPGCEHHEHIPGERLSGPADDPVNGTRIPSCGLCGVLVLDFDLHRSVCRPCVPHDFQPQWGTCGRCGHAERAVCHPAKECASCSAAEVVHASPRGDALVTPCCGKSPFEMSRTDRLTLEADLVTCGRPS